MRQVSKTQFTAMTSPELAATREVLKIVSNKTLVGYFTPPDVWEEQRAAIHWEKGGGNA